mgnify:CR=1 FL=1
MGHLNNVTLIIILNFFVIIVLIFTRWRFSNMSKLSEDGTPIYREDGKVLKGPNYFKPMIAEILSK